MKAAQQSELVVSDASLAACILAVDPFSIGGVSVRSRAGPERDHFVALVRSLLPADRPVRRLTPNIADDRLLGGLDLAATLQSKRPVLERGLLVEANGGLLIAPMAERMPEAIAARLAASLDSGEVTVERDGLTSIDDARIGVLALDEGLSDDETPPRALLDRLAIHLDLAFTDVSIADAPFAVAEIEAARGMLARVRADTAISRALCVVAIELGVLSVRAPILANKVARIHAALAGRMEVADEDVVVASRLVLLPRATRLPTVEEASDDTEPEETHNQDNADAAPSDADQSEPMDSKRLADIVLEAVAAKIPAGLLEKLKATATARAPSTGGPAGALRNSALRGRPVGALRSDVKAGVRLHLVETLRAAVPWQSLRRGESGELEHHVAIRREDFRIIRYKHRSETATIFVVDASGSAAMHRLAEAKGAVELLLADCYIRRDQVALISFRGKVAELILPPTRSLVRAKRTLAALPGGGGTPLAAAIDAGAALADSMRRKGISPTLVFLTDGRANVGRATSVGRMQALDDAYVAAKACRGMGSSTFVVDTSPHPGPSAERLAREIGGRYLPLPHADARGIASTLQREVPGRQSSGTH